MADPRNGDIITEKAARRYREEHVSGLGQKELILMLYDGAIKCASEAREALGKEDFVSSYKAIVKARDIVAELLCILNFEEGGDIAKNLRRLYVYVIGRLTEANFTKEIPLLDNVVTVLGNLRSAWAELDFQKALAEPVPGNGRDGEKGDSRTSPPRKRDEGSRILSVTA